MSIIAIDGPAGSGKSTTARLVAKRLGYLYLDTGALYRAVTLQVLEAGLELDDVAAIEALAAALPVRFERDLVGEDRVWIGERDVTREIRTMEVASRVSAVSALPGVRKALVKLQRAIGSQGNYVVEGRDIGTVVFPDAELKVFLVADLGQRAKRRLADLRRAGDELSTLKEVRASLAARDKLDSGRAIAPLRKAEDAFELDTSRLTIAEQVEKLIGFR